MSEPACAKCGTCDLGLSYHKQSCDKALCSCATCNYSDHAKVHKEHLHYYCRRCGWDWTGPLRAKLPLDERRAERLGSALMSNAPESYT